ncbi:MAG: GNAT family N-acetyltransferase [Proteobacteria bacterium]|nr:GNAT family N-acetyltransferase [Pseudomonadota bacterium]
MTALEIALFRTDRCSKKSLRYLVQHAHVIVARQQETLEIVGYAILLGRKNSRKMRIYSFGIVPAARNRGLAGKMIEHLEDIVKISQCHMLTLEVSDSNTAAVNLYKKHGFEQYGFRLGYYEDGGHAILMRKHIREDSGDDDHTLYKSCIH